MKKNKTKLKKYFKKRGFTLVEVLVSLALFSVVLVIAGGVISSIINIQKKNQIISSVVSNLNYSIDSMVRDIKTGYLYKCDYDENFNNSDPVNQLKADNGIPGNTKREGSCSDLTLVSTITGDDTVVRYKLIVPVNGENSYIQKIIYKYVNNTAEINTYSVTDKNEVDISDLDFIVKNPDALDVESANHGQPSVFVSIKGTAGGEDVNGSDFFVQTFISQRLINVTDFKD